MKCQIIVYYNVIAIPLSFLRQFESYNILQINEIDDTTIVGSDNKKKEQKK